jgi:hypothetical protein
LRETRDPVRGELQDRANEASDRAMEAEGEEGRAPYIQRTSRMTG